MFHRLACNYFGYVWPNGLKAHVTTQYEVIRVIVFFTQMWPWHPHHPCFVALFMERLCVPIRCRYIQYAPGHRSWKIPRCFIYKTGHYFSDSPSYIIMYLYGNLIQLDIFIRTTYYCGNIFFDLTITMYIYVFPLFFFSEDLQKKCAFNWINKENKPDRLPTGSVER